LDPRSLAVRSEERLPSSGHTDGIAGSLAAAGGQLWVGNGTLDRVSPAPGRVDRIVDPGHPGPVQLAAPSPAVPWRGCHCSPEIPSCSPPTPRASSTPTFPLTLTPSGWRRLRSATTVRDSPGAPRHPDGVIHGRPPPLRMAQTIPEEHPMSSVPRTHLSPSSRP
jgi:hypothetical protein